MQLYKTAVIEYKQKYYEYDSKNNAYAMKTVTSTCAI